MFYYLNPGLWSVSQVWPTLTLWLVLLQRQTFIRQDQRDSVRWTQLYISTAFDYSGETHRQESWDGHSCRVMRKLFHRFICDNWWWREGRHENLRGTKAPPLQALVGILCKLYQSGRSLLERVIEIYHILPPTSFCLVECSLLIIACHSVYQDLCEFS